ncbi:hypothetical protein MLD38_022404 [Melastoma candidum]|uniref:Uncharacterized protein n=1 Tax=Melastoma candidum TaxID=119954 RepID=A0ACB9QIG5_9MYRT|nr:hypothetical protein MLD38_022404 [Melastoma candidum]
MDVEQCSGVYCSDFPAVVGVVDVKGQKDSLRVKRKTLQAVLEQCQRALELLNKGEVDDEGERGTAGGKGGEEEEVGMLLEGGGSEALSSDQEADELCDLLKSRVECPDFLEKLESAQISIPQNLTEEGSSWDLVTVDDLWEEDDLDFNKDDYVVVRQEDIVDGIACFMAAYLLSLKETKDLTPNQLQEALSKTFSVKRKKGKLRKAWNGSKVVYNVASWGATAVGIYQNPVILQAASKAFWTSCHVISKLL